MQYPPRRRNKRTYSEANLSGDDQGLGLQLPSFPPGRHPEHSEHQSFQLSGQGESSRHLQYGSPQFPLPAMQQQQHHHHRLPAQALPPMGSRAEAGLGSSTPVMGPHSVVGQEGMPEPAPRPKGPKLKFTHEEDTLLVDLKENKNLTWKQIAEFFPGRTSGTLQVRYCTKLKAKTTVWTDDSVS